MYYTYILRSKSRRGAIYVGYTSDLKSRLIEHNNSINRGYTKKYSPWEVETYVAFSEEKDAIRFEDYLKSSSGKSFMKKHLISNHFKEALKEFNNGRNKMVSEASA